MVVTARLSNARCYEQNVFDCQRTKLLHTLAGFRADVGNGGASSRSISVSDYITSTEDRPLRARP
jgi:hypothetical protein